MRKKVKEPSNVRKKNCHMRMKPSNMKKKINEPPNLNKELSHVMLELHNVRIEPSNVRKK